MDNTDKFDNNIVNNTSILDFVKINDESVKNNQRNNKIKPVKQIEKMFKIDKILNFLGRDVYCYCILAMETYLYMFHSIFISFNRI